MSNDDVRAQMQALQQEMEDTELNIKKLRLDYKSAETKFERLATRHPEVAKELGWVPEAEKPPVAEGEKRGPGRPPAAKPATAKA